MSTKEFICLNIEIFNFNMFVSTFTYCDAQQLCQYLPIGIYFLGAAKINFLSAQQQKFN